ncbi:MAG: hypothetical protein Tsb0027_06920 [Wenzhouxiangellaceae bacterium]
MKLKLTCVALLLATAGTMNAAADVLLIEDVERAKAMQLPGNGLRQQQVAQAWGEPLQRYAAVGDPPITRWRYDSYSVYFEYDRVISAVLHHNSSQN